MTKKFMKRGFGLLMLTAAVYGGGFYIKWFYAGADIPTPSHLTSESRTGEGFQDLTESFANTLISFQKDLKVPALSAAVYKDGNFVWAGAQGYADIENGTPATPKSKFRLGSTSKPFVVALAYKMEESGLVDTSLPISTYIPDLPQHYGNLTLKQLLSHTSGVRNYKANFSTFPPHESYITDQYGSATEALEIFLDSQLIYAPGEGFQYSSWGFVLASAVLEAAGGKDFPTLLEEVLLKPYGLESTLAEFSGRNTDPLVVFYLTNDGGYTLTLPVNTSVKWAAGGLISTPENVAKFGAMLVGGDILDEASLEAIWTPVPLADGSMNPQNYGQGFRIDTSTRLFGQDQQTPIYHHGGLVSGGSSFMMIVPEYGIAVSVQTNTNERSARGGVQDLAYELVRIATGFKSADEATLTANEKPDFLDPEYISLTFQGNLSEMEDILEAREQTTNTATLLARFQGRFIDRTNGLDLAGEDPLVQRVGEAYQNYWRAALMDPDNRENYEDEMEIEVVEILEDSGVSSWFLNTGNYDEYLTTEFEKRGYQGILGLTPPLQEFMIWKTTDSKIHSVELTDGNFEVEVNYLSDFVSKGWSSFATFGGPSTGGWAKEDGLYIVTYKWDLDAEEFKLSFLKHETRHFSDFKLYPKLGPADLEYRAKLTELAYAEETMYSLMMTFTHHAAKIADAPHPLANWYVTTNLSKILLGSDWPANPSVWESIPIEDIRAEARKLLAEHDVLLKKEGAKSTKGIITP